MRCQLGGIAKGAPFILSLPKKTLTKGKPVNIKTALKKLLYILPNILLTLFAFLITLARFPKEPEILAEDALFQHPSAIPTDIKIIAIDEATLAKLGPYSQWDRSYFAELIEILNSDPDAKPALIGMDIIFSGENGSDGEKRLAEAVKNSVDVVLASKLETETKAVKNESINSYEIISSVSGEVTAYSALSEVCDSGFTNIILDEDSYVRRIYTYIDDGENTYKSFACKVAEKITGGELSALPETAEIQYTGKPGDFETISMASVLDKTVPAGYFADSIVLIGAHEEGMLDSYKVPVDKASQMYGVECQANALYAILNGKFILSLPIWAEALIAAAITAVFGIIARGRRLRTCIAALIGILAAYPLFSVCLYSATGLRLSVLFVPIGVIVTFLVFLLLRYVEVQKKRADDMQKMLFSMADSMAEAIEGRTPYNANHTKNVAKRCIELLDHINLMHKQKKTKLHFTKKDRNQLYLAAMLHDIGKMDVPLEVMDKPTKLGDNEERLRSRLEIIKLKLENDALKGAVAADTAKQKTAEIDSFIDKLGLYNCGKPLGDEDKAFIDRMCSAVYISPDNEEIRYITKEEADDLHIKAGTLSDGERSIMQSHAVYTDKILEHMHFGKDFSDVRKIAANHHELLNAKGYPKGLGAENLDILTRILTVMDIYDSLIADDRPYKKAKPVKAAFSILDEEADAGKIDRDIVEIAKDIWLEKENQ